MAEIDRRVEASFDDWLKQKMRDPQWRAAFEEERRKKELRIQHAETGQKEGDSSEDGGEVDEFNVV